LVVYIIYINDAQSSKYQIMKYIRWLCLYYLYQWCTVKQVSDNEIYSLIMSVLFISMMHGQANNR